jgi:hypothetical protein
MYLLDYFHPGGLREFDPASGAVKRPPPGAARDQFGFVWKQSGRWFAIRSDDESLLFQQGSETWRLRPENEFHVTPGPIRKVFTIEREGRVVFSLRYRLRLFAVISAIVDPAYDAMSQEADDFFVYVVNMWQGWKDLPMSAFVARVQFHPPGGAPDARS